MIWRFRNFKQDRARSLSENLGQSLKIGQFLAARGFNDAEEVLSFIKADIKELPAPLSFTDMDKALNRLLTARKDDQLLAVCGDYDADGLTASALLTRGLSELGHRIINRIPNRLNEGYGLKAEAVDELKDRGIALIVTVDNGISDHLAVERAAALGIDVIITDHHKLPPKLPPAVAIINPHRDKEWKKSPLAGVGVAFMLLAALKRHYQDKGLIGKDDGPNLMDYLPLVAIGTVADMVPLSGPNRILVRHGLHFLANSKMPGLEALKKVCRIASGRLCPSDVGFRLAPRLNAAGRLGSSEPALDLLLANDHIKAEKLAQQLEDINRQRYKDQGKLCQEALEKMEAEISPDSFTIVLFEEGWPKGLLGLAASRLAEESGKPTILFSIENGQAIGSGRSAGNFNLYSALNDLRHLFLSFGGHPQAAGLTLSYDKLAEFISSFEETASQRIDSLEEIVHDVDIEADVADLAGLWKPLGALEPFGQDNPPPLIAVMGAKIKDARPTDSGGKQHMKLFIEDGLHRWTIMGFNLAHRLFEIGPQADLLLSLEFSEYKGEIGPNWRLVDFRAPQRDQG